MNTQVISILEQKKIKPTPMRMLVLEQLLILNRNSTLSELEKLLYPADRITIYRTLQTFSKHGIVHSLETVNKGISYALCSPNCTIDIHFDNHPHLYCEVCKTVTCNNDFEFTMIQKHGTNLKINKVEVTISGICKECELTTLQ